MSNLFFIYSLGFLIAFLFFLWLAGFVLFKDPKSSLNRVCALLCVSFAIWSFGDLLTNIYLKTNPFFSIGWCIFPSFALWFILVFTKKKRIFKYWIIYLLFFLLPLIFIYKQWQGLLLVDIATTPYAWFTVWSKSIWTYLYYAYYLSFILTGFYLVFDFMRKTKDFAEKSQAKIILIVGIITLILGSVTNVLLPELKIHIVPSIASILTTIWAAGTVYAITKYGLMTVTPTLATEAVIMSLTDSLILVNLEGKITFANKTTSDLLGYKGGELIGKSIDFLTEGKPSFEGLLKEEIIRNYETNYVSGSGEKIPVSLNSSLIKDKSGKLAGAVVIAHDIREIRKLIAELGEKIKTLEVASRKAEKTRLATLNILEDVEETRIALQERVAELEKFNKLSVGRELKMIELKEEIQRLKTGLEQKQEHKEYGRSLK
jgi:PAS domain S-box-containing protein